MKSLFFLPAFFLVLAQIAYAIDKSCAPFLKDCKNVSESNCAACVNDVKSYLVVLKPSTAASQADKASANKKILEDHENWIKGQIENYPKSLTECSYSPSSTKLEFRRDFTINTMIGYNAALNKNLLALICQRDEVDYVEEDKKIVALKDAK